MQPDPVSSADPVLTLERGFGSFRPRSRSPRRFEATWPEAPPDFYKDIVGLIGVKDGHGLLVEEAFPIDVLPLPSERVLGARRVRRRRLQVRHTTSYRPLSPPPKRRYFRTEKAFKLEQDASWQVAATAAAVEMGRSQASQNDQPDFLPLLTAASQLNVASWGASTRSARLSALRQRCQQAPGDASNWLDFAEFQWSQVGEELDVPAQQVREKQRAVLEAALKKQSGPPDVRLIRALATAEGDGAANMPVQEILACRRQRLLQCSHAEVAEELVWGFLEVCLLGGAGHKEGSLLEGAPLELRGLPIPGTDPAPIETFRRAVAETLAFLAVRKVAAGHDGQAVAALERAELACISCLCMAEAASGRSSKALELVRGLATWNVFGSEGDPSFFASIWKARCRLGARGALRALQQLGTLGLQLPEALQPLAQTLDALEDPCDAFEKPPAGHFCAMLRAGGGRLRNWCADELQRSMGLNHLGVLEPEMSFEELEPFLLSFRTEEARKESVLRLLDLLGAPTLSRHPATSRYRQSFLEAFAPLSLRFSEEIRIPPYGMLPACSHREAMKTHTALQSLALWPREALLHEVLVDSLRRLSSNEALKGQASKLPRRVLRASEDPRLYFIYAHGLWQSGASDETRHVLLKLCGAEGVTDARIAMAWWHLELTGPRALARAQRVVLALAFGCFDEGVLSDAPLDSREAGLRRLQALARLQQLLPRSSQTDGSNRFLLSSYQAVVLATCTLHAQTSARKALDFFLKEVPVATADVHRPGAMTMDAGPLRPTALSRAALLETVGWARAAEQLLVLLSVAEAPPKIRLEGIRLCLQLDPGSSFALRHLAKLRLQQGLVNTLRRELDEVLGLHRPTPLGASAAQWLESFRVALHAELLLDAGSGSNSISNASGQRRSALCERAMKLASPVATGNLWCLYGLMLLLKLQREGRGAAELWRCSVRATSRLPISKVAWLLHLAACEARALPGDAPEEEVIDLVEAIESKEIFLHSDPLEAIA